MKISQTRNALIVSALSTFLCLAMLVSTSFAWFSDTASTNVNKIVAGRLAVDLQMHNGSAWVSAAGQELLFKKARGAGEEPTLWEPGCTYELPQLRVVNTGNLVIKYKLVIEGGERTGAQLLSAIDFTYRTGESQTFDINAEYELRPGAASNPIIITGTMKSDAGNAYQGQNIEGLKITVLAGQPGAGPLGGGQTTTGGAGTGTGTGGGTETGTGTGTGSGTETGTGTGTGTGDGTGEVANTITFTSADEFSETAAGKQYSTKTFTAAGITCAADVYLETVPDLTTFKLTLKEADENQADFIITKNDDSKAFVQLILEGYSADASSPALVIYFKDVKAVAASKSGSYGFDYELTAEIEGESYVGLGGFYLK